MPPSSLYTASTASRGANVDLKNLKSTIYLENFNLSQINAQLASRKNIFFRYNKIKLLVGIFNWQSRASPLKIIG